MYGRRYYFNRPSWMDYLLVLILLIIVVYSIYLLLNTFLSHGEPCSGYIMGEVYEPAHQQMRTGYTHTYDKDGYITGSTPYTYYVTVPEKFIFHVRLSTGEVIRAETDAATYYEREPDTYTACTIRIGFFSGTPVGYTVP